MLAPLVSDCIKLSDRLVRYHKFVDRQVLAQVSDGRRARDREDVGLIALEYSAFAVDGRPDLGMVIYNPATPADADRIKSLVKTERSPFHRRTKQV